MVVGVPIVGPGDGGMMFGANFVAAYPWHIYDERMVEDAPGCGEQGELGKWTEEWRRWRFSPPSRILWCAFFPSRIIWRHGV